MKGPATNGINEFVLTAAADQKNQLINLSELLKTNVITSLTYKDAFDGLCVRFSMAPDAEDLDAMRKKWSNERALRYQYKGKYDKLKKELKGMEEKPQETAPTDNQALEISDLKKDIERLNELNHLKDMLIKLLMEQKEDKA